MPATPVFLLPELSLFFPVKEAIAADRLPSCVPAFSEGVGWNIEGPAPRPGLDNYAEFRRSGR